MTQCEPDAAGNCLYCGRPCFARGVHVHRACRQSPDLLPAAEKLGITLDDARHYAAALARWTIAGWPVRPPAEVARIFVDCCQPCEHFAAGRCALCRCRVAPGGLAVANKIRMATEKCPLGLW